MPFSRARVIAPEYDRIAPCAPSIGRPRGCDLNAFITFDRERAIASAHKATLDRLRAAGAELVDVDMPGLVDLNGKMSFPVALYEARADPPGTSSATGSRSTWPPSPGASRART
jgi:hypothetical protein